MELGPRDPRVELDRLGLLERDLLDQLVRRDPLALLVLALLARQVELDQLGLLERVLLGRLDLLALVPRDRRVRQGPLALLERVLLGRQA